MWDVLGQKEQIQMTRYKSKHVFKKYMDTDTFIGKFMLMMSSSETPVAYDFWAAIWVLGTALGRQVVVPRPHAPIFMNWYVIIVANSGITRKSTAVNAAKNILQRYQHKYSAPIHVVDGKNSPEAFEDQMVKMSDEYGYARMAVVASELARFLGKEQYMMKMPTLLVDMYDMPRTMEVNTLARGRGVIKTPFVSFFSASTPRWLNKTVNPTVIEGGFTSRTIFIKAEKRKKKVPWPEETADLVTEDEIVTHLRKIVEVAQDLKEIKLTEGAMEMFGKWYRSKPESITPFQSSFESREDAHVLRLAACLAINNEQYMIDNMCIRQAIKIINAAKSTGAYLFEGNVRPEDTQIGVSKLIQTIVTAGNIGVKTSDIYRQVSAYMNGQTMNYLLQIMLELEMVTKLVEKNTRKRGRNAAIWTMTTRITDFNLRQKLSDYVESIID